MTNPTSPGGAGEALLAALDSGDHVRVGLMGYVLNDRTADLIRTLLTEQSRQQEALRGQIHSCKVCGAECSC
jgi:hypothetical protein